MNPRKTHCIHERWCQVMKSSAPLPTQAKAAALRLQQIPQNCLRLKATERFPKKVHLQFIWEEALLICAFSFDSDGFLENLRGVKVALLS